MKLFEYEDTANTTKKLTKTDLKEIKSYIRQIYVDKIFIYNCIFVYDIRDNTDKHIESRNKILKENKSLDDIIKMVSKHEIKENNVFTFFCSKIYRLKNKVNDIYNNALPNEKEMIKLFIKNEFGNYNMRLEKNELKGAFNNDFAVNS